MDEILKNYIFGRVQRYQFIFVYIKKDPSLLRKVFFYVNF